MGPWIFLTIPLLLYSLSFYVKEKEAGL
jgi:hypothetical protein